MIYVLMILLIASISFNGVSMYKLFKNLNIFIGVIQSTHSVEFGAEMQVGDTAADFKSKDQHGNTISNNQLLDGYKFLFVSSTCPTCKNIIAKMNTLNDDVLKNLIVVSQGSIEQKHIELLSSMKISYLDDMKIVDDFNVRSVPKLIEVNESDTIAHITEVNGIEDLKKLSEKLKVV